MYYADIPTLDNIIHDIPSHNIGDMVLQQGENIIFKDGVIQQRSGMINFSSTSLPFPDKITGISLYNKLKTLERILIVFTEKDIYKYDAPANVFKYITRVYNLGTTTTSGTGYRTITLNPTTYTPTGTFDIDVYKVTVSSTTGLAVGMLVAGTGIAIGSRIIKIDNLDIYLDLKTTSASTTVTLTIQAQFKTTWDKTNLYEISFDSADPTLCNTWYNVASIGSGTILTLSENAVTKTNSVYCLRLCYSGDQDNTWSVTYPYDPDTNDRAMIATNGCDRVQILSNTDQCTDLWSYANYCQNICSFGSIGYHHIFCCNVFDTGSTIQFRQTIEISDAGALTWIRGDYYELIDKEYELRGMLPLRSQLAIYTSNSISMAQIGTATNPLIVSENIIRNVGTPSIRTVIDIGQVHLFWSGKSIYMFDGIQAQDIGQGNSQYIFKNINNSYQYKSFAVHMPEQNLYCLFIPWGDSTDPNMCVVYNYATKQWMFWNFNDITNATMYLLAQGEYVKTYAPRWNDLTLPWSAMTQRWSDLITNENFARMIFGDSNGYLYEYSNDSATDSGYAIASSLMTKDYPLNKLEADFRLLETILQLRLKESPTGYYNATLTIRASVDAGRTWSAYQTVNLDGNDSYMEKKQYWNMSGKHVRFDIRFSNPLIIEALRIGFNAQYKSMKFDN